MSLINSVQRGALYTRSALVTNANADLALRSKPIRRLARKSIPDITEQLSKRQITVLDEADLKLASKRFIYVMSFGGQVTASNAARLLATQSAQSGRNVVLCDTTGQVEKEIKEKTMKDDSAFAIHKINDSLSVVTGATGALFYSNILMRN